MTGHGEWGLTDHEQVLSVKGFVYCSFRRICHWLCGQLLLHKLCKIQCTSDTCIIKEKAVFKLYNKCDHSNILSIKRYRHIKLPEGQDRRGTHLIDIKNV